MIASLFSAFHLLTSDYCLLSFAFPSHRRAQSIGISLSCQEKYAVFPSAHSGMQGLKGKRQGEQDGRFDIPILQILSNQIRSSVL
jgi:hypothetical protein